MEDYREIPDSFQVPFEEGCADSGWHFRWDGEGWGGVGLGRARLGWTGGGVRQR